MHANNCYEAITASYTYSIIKHSNSCFVSRVWFKTSMWLKWLYLVHIHNFKQLRTHTVILQQCATITHSHKHAAKKKDNMYIYCFRHVHKITITITITINRYNKHTCVWLFCIWVWVSMDPLHSVYSANWLLYYGMCGNCSIILQSQSQIENYAIATHSNLPLSPDFIWLFSLV